MYAYLKIRDGNLNKIVVNETIFFRRTLIDYKKFQHFNNFSPLIDDSAKFVGEINHRRLIIDLDKTYIEDSDFLYYYKIITPIYKKYCRKEKLIEIIK